MSGSKVRVARWAAFGLIVGALSIVAAGCGGGDDGGGASTAIEGLGSSLEEIQELAREEGEVNIVQWAGYAQLVDEFAAATGCKVNTKDGGSSDDMISLIQTGAYDGVSASGNASVRLMTTGDVAPVNPDFIPNFLGGTRSCTFLRNRSWIGPTREISVYYLLHRKLQMISVLKTETKRSSSSTGTKE